MNQSYTACDFVRCVDDLFPQKRPQEHYCRRSNFGVIAVCRTGFCRLSSAAHAELLCLQSAGDLKQLYSFLPGRYQWEETSVYRFGSSCGGNIDAVVCLP